MSKQKNIIKKLSAEQIFGVLIAYVIAVLIAFSCIYFGGNWIAHQISHTFFSVSAFILVVLLTLSIIQFFLRKILFKITNGFFGSL